MIITSFLFLLLYSSFTTINLYIHRLTLLIIVFSTLLFINSINFISLYSGLALYNNFLMFNMQQVPLIILIFIITISLLIYDNVYGTKYGVIYIIIIVNLGSILLFILTNDLISLYILIELQSYSLYILTGYYNRSYNATRAGLLYFLTGGIASAIILLSSYYVYSVTGSTDLSDIELYNLYDQSLMPYICILLIALMFKAGLAPLHKWSISVYNYAPTHITAYISIMPKLAIISFIYTHINLFSDYRILIVFFYLSVFIGAYKPLFQINLKIILAYSGLLNFGYILISTTVFDQSFYIYLIQYSLTHILLFLLILVIQRYIDKPISLYSPLIFIKQLQTGNNTITAILILTLFSLIGIPPLAGFYGKYYLLIDLIKYNYIIECLVIIVFSVLSTYYYANIIKILVQPLNNTVITKLPIVIINPSIALIIATLFTILLTYYLILPWLLEGLYLIVI